MFLPYTFHKYMYRDSHYQYIARRQVKISIYYQYYIEYDENNGENYIRIWQAVLKLAR